MNFDSIKYYKNNDNQIWKKIHRYTSQVVAFKLSKPSRVLQCNKVYTGEKFLPEIKYFKPNKNSLRVIRKANAFSIDNGGYFKLTEPHVFCYTHRWGKKVSVITGLLFDIKALKKPLQNNNIFRIQKIYASLTKS